MRVLILSCNTGGGHNICAEAIREAFTERGYPCDIAESIHFVSDRLSRFVSWGHTAMYRHIPALFRFGYDLAERYPSLLRDKGAAYKLLTGGTAQLAAFLGEGGYDTVICTHVFSGFLLRQTMREYSLRAITAFVGTDYTCSPGTAGSELDHYFIPDRALTAEFTARGVPESKIIPVGIPIRRAFYQRQEKRAAKQRLGLDPNRAHLLMMCGSMGCGPMKKLTKLLGEGLDESMELSVVCGTNEKLRAELTKAHGTRSDIHIHGFVEDMSALMDSADLYLTKPGGLSTTEAAAKNLPMVFIDAVAGCETYNLRHFTALGGAAVADGLKGVSCLCLELLRSEKRRKQMEVSLEILPRRNAADCICKTMIEMSDAQWQKRM